MLERLRQLEENQREFKKTFYSSVDDLKSIIRSEVSDLKQEQIGDLRESVRQLSEMMRMYEQRIRELEHSNDRMTAGAGLLGWVARISIAIGSLIVGYFGGRHL